MKDYVEATPAEEALELSTSTKLVLNFAKANGNDMSLTYNYARQDASNANIKLLMEGIVANGAIFQNIPIAIRSAKIVTTETTDVDLS